MAVPVLQTLAGYRKSWLRHDIIAGIVLVTLLVPQGMAYAELAGLPVITGLYTTVLCLLAYAVFGPSRVLVLGPDSSLGPMIAATIIPIVGSGGDPERAVALASALAVAVGVIMLAAGLFKLGFVADLLSSPTRIGYMNGLAVTIFVSQLPKLFGFSTDADGFLYEVGAFVQGAVSGMVVSAAALIGLASLLLIVVLSRWVPRIPAVLAAVVAAVIAAGLFDLAGQGVSLVGSLPQGLPPFTLPEFRDVPVILAGALAIAIVALTDTISTASSFAARHKQELNGSGEMIGIGAANVATSFFQGFPVSTSGSRTAVAEQAGAKTQLAGMVGASLILLMLLLVPGLLRNLPQPTLAAVVIAASFALVDIGGIKRLWSQRRSEFLLAMTAFAGVALLGVLPGIALAVGLSILNVFRHAWWPYQTMLGRLSDLPGYHDKRRRPDAVTAPGLVIFRFVGPLFFANARTFREQVRHIASAEPRPRWILIAAEPVTDIDSTAAAMLTDLKQDLDAINVRLVFAELISPVRAKFESYGLASMLVPGQYYPTLDEAYDAYGEQVIKTQDNKHRKTTDGGQTYE